MNKRNVYIFIAVSIDGYIAKEDGSIDWLSMVQREGEDYGYEEFIQKIDTVIMGRKTYEKILTFEDFPHKTRRCFVLTRQEREQAPDVTFYNNGIRNLMNELQANQGKDIFIDGGAEVINEMIQENLIDSFIISIIPIFLGNGIKLFRDKRAELKMQLKKSVSYPSGLVQLWYEKNDGA